MTVSPIVISRRTGPNVASSSGVAPGLAASRPSSWVEVHGALDDCPVEENHAQPLAVLAGLDRFAYEVVQVCLSHQTPPRG